MVGNKNIADANTMDIVGAPVHEEMGIMTNEEQAMGITLLPFSIDMKYGREDEDVISMVEKGVSLLVTKKQLLVTSFNNQTSVEFQIVKRVDSMTESFGRVILKDMRPAPKGSKIEVTFKIDGVGIEGCMRDILDISAKDANNRDIKIVKLSKMLDYYEELKSKELYYEILGVNEDADQGDIEDAGYYRSGLYPDYSKEYEIINEARNALLPGERDLYDKKRFIQKEVDGVSKDVLRSIMDDGEIKERNIGDIKEKGYIRNKILGVFGQKREQIFHTSNPLGLPPFPGSFKVGVRLGSPYIAQHPERLPPFPGKRPIGGM